MVHWRKSYPAPSQFNSFAGWMIGASMLVSGGARVYRPARARMRVPWIGLCRLAGTTVTNLG